MGLLDFLSRRTAKPAQNGHAPPRHRIYDDDADEHDYMKSASDDYAAASFGENPSEITAGADAERYFNWYVNFVWVAVAMNARANNAASVPKRCVKVKADYTTEDLPPSNPLCKLMAQPNRHQGPRKFMKRFMLHLDAAGMAFVLMDEGRAPEEMYLLKPERTRIVPDPVKFIKGFRYDVRHSRTEVNKFFYTYPDQAWYHNYDDPRSEYLGLSPLTTLARTIQIEDYVQRWTLATFKNNCRVDQVFETDNQLERTAKRRFLSEFFAAFRGVDNQGKTFIAENGLKLKQLGLNPKDTEFLSLRKVNWREILAVYGVTPAIAGVTEDINYATANEQRRGFWENTMIPTLSDIDETFTARVARRFGDDYAIVHDYSLIEALRENSNERVTRLSVMRASGAISADEFREEMNYEAIGSPVMVAVMKPGVLMDPISGEAVGPEPEPVAGPGGMPGDDDKDEKSAATGKAYGSREYRELAWKAFDRNARKLIKSFSREMAEFFDGQKARVVAKLRQFTQKKDAIDTGFDPFNADEEARRFLEKMRAAYLDALRDAGENRVDDLAVVRLSQFDAATDRVLHYIQNQAAKRIVGINVETEALVRVEMEAGFKAGESIDQLAARLESMFDAFARSYPHA